MKLTRSIFAVSMIVTTATSQISRADDLAAYFYVGTMLDREKLSSMWSIEFLDGAMSVTGPGLSACSSGAKLGTMSSDGQEIVWNNKEVEEAFGRIFAGDDTPWKMEVLRSNCEVTSFVFQSE
jgi:hypothetical protein